MYAIVEVGAKQYQVKKGDCIAVERQNADLGKEIKLDKVLLVFKDKKLEIGQPYVKGACVQAEVLAHPKGPKVVSFKYWRRKGKHWKKGHRQELTELKIKEIDVAG